MHSRERRSEVWMKSQTPISCVVVFQRERERDLFLENRVGYCFCARVYWSKGWVFSFFFGERGRVLAEKTVEMERREGGCE